MATVMRQRHWLLMLSACIYIYTFQFSSIHLDLARDFRVAQGILDGADYPAVGQLLGGRFRLGPVWYYFLALMMWLLGSWLYVILGLATVASSQFFLAYLLGKELGSKLTGIIYAVLLLFPSWGFIEQVFPEHNIFVPTLIMATNIGAIRFFKHGKLKYLYLQAILFSLSLHAHPTALVAGLPAAYFTLRRLSEGRFDFKIFALAILLFVGPFGPMLYSQAAMGFPMAHTLSAYADQTARSINFTQTIPLLFKSISGFQFIAHWTNWIYEILSIVYLVVATMVLGFFLERKAYVIGYSNLRQGLIRYGLVPVVLVMGALTLILISPIYPYYYTSALRCIWLAIFAWALSGMIERSRLKTLLLSVLFGGIFLSNGLMVWRLQEWSRGGILPVNVTPLYDVLTAQSETRLLPFVAAASESDIRAWLCQTDFDSLHGALASHLIYNYAMQTQHGCPNKKYVIGRPVHNLQQGGFAGFSAYTTAALKRNPFNEAGPFHIFRVVATLGSALVVDPHIGPYPPYSDPAAASTHNVTLDVDLKKGQYLALTNLSLYFGPTIDFKVREGDRLLTPVAADMQARIYTCSYCDGRKILVEYDETYRSRVDAVVF